MRDDERAVEDSDVPESGAGESAEHDDLVQPYGEPGHESLDDRDEDLELEGEESAEAEDSFDDSDESLELEDEVTSEEEAVSASAAELTRPTFIAPVFHNFMDALYPTKPPVIQNARIIRRFDLEAAKYDPRPNPASTVEPTSGATPVAPAPAGAAPAPAAQKKTPALTREEARALRNRSLRAAAGLD